MENCMENIGVKETVGFTYVTCIPVCVDYT